MPLYEYQCENCGDVFEVIQKFADTPLTVHEKCGGAVHRLLSAPALMFKGSGWYVNDYAKAGNNASNGGSKKGESSENSGSSSEAKDKAAAKSESANTSKSSESSSPSPASATTSSSSSDKK
ncbi:MAG TPA: FmdB family zinc ribbon protein [Bryobacteraceae bacterium]|nr:FmdB family zinc ribbon protein [Bryobacteraceae bacterium]